MRLRLTLVLLACAAALPAQTAQQRGKELIEKSIAALGGEKFLTVEDRIETGRAYSFYREQLSGLAISRVYTRYLTGYEGAAKADELSLRERQTFGKKEDSLTLFTEREAWRVTYRGAKPIPRELLERYRETTLRNIFYILRYRLKEPGIVIESRGSDIVDNTPTDVVAITDRDNRVVSVYLNKNTHLPVQQVTKRRDAATTYQIEERTIFNKYRDVGGGVMWPFAILRERDGEKVFEMFSETVTINNNLADQMFMLSGDTKVLPEKK